MATTKTKTKEKELELSPFANNGHATEYTKMMHRYADLDKREKACVENNVSQTGCCL